MTKPINTLKAPAAIGPYSQGILAGSFVFTSGQLPIEAESGKLEAADIKKAAEISINNCKAILEAGGASLKNVVKTTVFLTDLNDFTSVNEVYERYFPQNPPARSCFQVAALPKGAKIEIEMTAFI
ncbi:MAG: RidA family protein [Spirochaetaceae bacterium]|nr:RidA family protein [Spirochaetaceae bacterium]